MEGWRTLRKARIGLLDTGVQDNANWEDNAGDADVTQTILGASSSISQYADGHLNAVNSEDSDEKQSAGKFFGGVGATRRLCRNSQRGF